MARIAPKNAPPSRRAVPLATLLLASACAIANEDRRRVLNHMDEHWTPSSSTARWLAAPIALPVGIVGLATDALLVHPITQIDDAWGDTVEVLWEFDSDDQFRNVLMAPLAAAATPVVFAFDWLGRSVFDIPDRDPPDDEEPGEPVAQNEFERHARTLGTVR